ncbi:hypothetical protein [Polluticoccus soli]|uniref:hypothetical protein n=1 Tax=Polluticoccus soli TaxID=3034150 RepID=UPI0023E133A7|nr:hypothetical protein [Flavipsychrobacter sp. JY13-12]
MKYLVDSAIGQPLLAFVFAYYLVNVIGAEIRKHNPAINGTLASLSEEDFRQVKKSRLCKLLSLGFVTMAILFAMFPKLYNALPAIATMKYPVYNLFGLILLGVAFVRMLLVHVDIDTEMYIHNQQGEQMSNAAVMNYTHRMLSGYYTMFVGFTFILSNWACIVLLILTAIAYREK